MSYENNLYDFEFLKLAVDEYPDKVAVKDATCQYTYKELCSRATLLSCLFLEAGVKKGSRIGIFMENNADYIICIVAAMQISTIFVPLSPAYPSERLDCIIKNCLPEIVVTNNKNNKNISNVVNSNNTKIINIQSVNYDGAHEMYKFPVKIRPKDIVYIIYTSGSTGYPKGVAIRWESLNNYIKDTTERLKFDDKLVTLNMTPFYFDGSLTGIFCALFCLGTLIITPSMLMRERQFIKLLKDENVTDLGCSPAHLKFLADALKRESSNNYAVQSIAVGGQSFSDFHIKEILQLLPDVTILNRYGPTETTIVVSSHEITCNNFTPNKKFPIGKPLRNVTFHVVDESGNSVETGGIGELYIGGIQVMDGYWNDSVLTDKAISINSSTGERLYKSGDLVTIDSHGNYFFIGRADDMVKTNGYRIYPLEIESALIKLPYI